MPATKSPRSSKASGKGGGHKAPSSKSPTSYDSIAAAAAALKIPKEVLQKAKRAAAPGFKGSRVYPGELLPYLDAHLAELIADGSKEDLEKEKLREAIRKLRWENDLNDKLYVKRGAVEAWIADTVEKIKGLLRKKLRNQLPPKIEGLRAAEISAKMESEVIAPLCELLRFVHEAPADTTKAE